MGSRAAEGARENQPSFTLAKEGRTRQKGGKWFKEVTCRGFESRDYEGAEVSGENRLPDYSCWLEYLGREFSVDCA